MKARECGAIEVVVDLINKVDSDTCTDGCWALSGITVGNGKI